MSSELYYPLAQEWWPAKGFLSVIDEAKQQLLLLPIDYLEIGHVSTFAFVMQQIAFCYEEEGMLQNSDESNVVLAAQVHAGQDCFLRAGMSTKV
jgi:hypothetical protein